MKVNILTSCTSKKAVNCQEGLTAEDFDRGLTHVLRREKALADYMMSAGEMYTGQQHRHLMKGVQVARRRGAKIEFDVAIVSAGYGVVSEDRRIAPYNRAFARMRKGKIRDLADCLKIPEDSRSFLSDPADLILVLLGEKYLHAVDLDDTVTFGGPTLLFCSRNAAESLPEWPQVKKVAVTRETARQFSEGLVWLKGHLVQRLLLRMVDNPDVVAEIIDPEADVLEILNGYSAQTMLEY